MSEAPVLVVDALGFANKIAAADEAALADLGSSLDRQFHRFQSKIPFAATLTTKKRVFGTGEFSTFQLNDMFVLFYGKSHRDAAFRLLVATCLVYHALLLEGFVPRGGLGFGLVLRRNGWFIGKGFIDAYQVSEKRDDATRNICGIQVSPSFLQQISKSTHAMRLLYFYDGQFFVNPHGLNDPEMGEFSKERILRLLESAGANREKLADTRRFLEEGEDFETAKQPNSRSTRFARENGWPT